MIHRRIISGPIRLTGSIHPRQLASLIVIDALTRRRAAQGEPQATWELTTIVGDVAVHRAVQRAVAREGDDREELGRDAFAARAKRLEEEASADLRNLLAVLRVQADLERWNVGGDAATRAARVAFVRLYEAGLLRRTDAILDSCPSCETVVDDADADEVELELSHIRMRLPIANGHLEIDLAEPELLVGAVAVAVPANLTTITDETVKIPLLDAEVPIVTVEDLAAPVIVVPGHNVWSHDLARQLGLPIVEVLDGDGVVRHPGPLIGQGRYAARATATHQLEADGYVVGTFVSNKVVKRCYRCATVLVPLFGRHWILSIGELVEPVMDAVRAGKVAFLPPSAADRLVEDSVDVRTWCVSQQLWSGHQIPVSTCLDCGKTTVSVEENTSCGSCMGTLQPHEDVLDARFIAAITPLAMLGWPNDFSAEQARATTLAIGWIGIEAWALPMAALGLRLAGELPFAEVLVHQPPESVDAGQRVSSELIDLVEAHGVRVVRAAVLHGDFDLDQAKASVELLDDPPQGEADLESYVEAYDKALSLLDGHSALDMLVNAVRTGIATSSSNRLAALARPLLTE